jgi:hypothetical protein
MKSLLDTSLPGWAGHWARSTIVGFYIVQLRALKAVRIQQRLKRAMNLAALPFALSENLSPPLLSPGQRSLCRRGCES